MPNQQAAATTKDKDSSYRLLAGTSSGLVSTAVSNPLLDRLLYHACCSATPVLCSSPCLCLKPRHTCGCASCQTAVTPCSFLASNSRQQRASSAASTARLPSAAARPAMPSCRHRNGPAQEVPALPPAQTGSHCAHTAAGTRERLGSLHPFKLSHRHRRMRLSPAPQAAPSAAAAAQHAAAPANRPPSSRPAAP